MCCDDWEMGAVGPLLHSLNAGWELCGLEESAGVPGTGAEWIPATVPGDIHIDLAARGRIPDPFVDEQYREAMFAEELDWWYRLDLVLPPKWESLDRVELVFEGLDTVATVTWNGEEIATGRNMWVPVRIDVTERVRAGGPVELLVRLRSPLREARELMPAEADPMVTGFFSPVERTYVRKAQMSYGWDIAPRIVTCGIWRPVRLEGFRVAAVRDVTYRTRLLPDNRACVAISIEAERFAGADGAWVARIAAACGESRLSLEVPLEADGSRLTGEAEVLVDNPRLWWTWDLGEPNLYEARCEVTLDGVAVAERRERFGIREVGLCLTDQSTGANRFSFTLNGRPTFLRGTNWIPVDCVFARVTRERLAEVLDLALETSCNSLRIWGGGVYEDPVFYELCDERGLLVWQDFMFACGLYPQEPWFLEEVRREAEHVVRSLRNHACLLMWAGDNECDCSYAWHGTPGDYVRNRITREVLPQVVRALDPTRPYIPSSPWNPSDTGDPNHFDEGDTHLWSHDQPPRAPMYSEDRSLFLSEIGRICPATLGTIARFLSREHRWPHANPVWEQHVGTIPTSDFQRRQRMDDAVRNTLGYLPETEAEYVEASQLLQAWCLSEWIERARRRKPECWGILWWNLFDNWPQHSDAVVDHYFGRKPAFQAVGRVSTPVALSIAAVDAGWGVWVLNDLDDGVSGRVVLERRSLEGETTVLGTTEVTVGPNESAMVLASGAEGTDAQSSYLVARLESAGGVRETRYVLDGCQSVAVLRAVYGD